MHPYTSRQPSSSHLIPDTPYWHSVMLISQTRHHRISKDDLHICSPPYSLLPAFSCTSNPILTICPPWAVVIRRFCDSEIWGIMTILLLLQRSAKSQTCLTRYDRMNIIEPRCRFVDRIYKVSTVSRTEGSVRRRRRWGKIYRVLRG